MDLTAFRWKNRLLLLFVPDASAPEYIDQWDTLNRHWDALIDRDLLVVSIFEADGGDIDGAEISEDDTEALRRQFKVKPSWAAAVLVGKDGTEKQRYPMPADPAKVAALIDTMPMRQREMREDE